MGYTEQQQQQQRRMKERERERERGNMSLKIEFHCREVASWRKKNDLREECSL